MQTLIRNESAGLELLSGFPVSNEQENDRELVERARSGDQEAFSELVRTHRAKMYGWANKIAQDEYLAEDIVQDALIRAFLHLGTLMDTNRFLPWLQRIFRNQAYMKLRRGGPYAKERLFSGFKTTNAENNGEEDSQRMDWGDIDRILFHMSKSAAEEAKRNHDPARGILRKELMDHLRALIHCLSKRERQIFEAHFFGELSPAEIAVMFDTSTANVYNILSRSKSKVQRERIRVSIRLYVQQRAELGRKRVNILPPPNI